MYTGGTNNRGGFPLASKGEVEGTDAVSTRTRGWDIHIYKPRGARAAASFDPGPQGGQGFLGHARLPQLRDCKAAESNFGC